MFNWLTGKKVAPPAVQVDLHSHLLPGLDDGVQSFDEAGEIIRMFQALGYKKLITTPHVISDSYRNTSETILAKLADLKAWLAQRELAIDIGAAAEYYLDEELVAHVQRQQPLLTFGDRYVLFEINFMVEPLNLKDFIFLLTTQGYIPVLAHPERYVFLQNRPDKLEDLINRGVLFQLNINSLSGYYSKPAQALARKLIEKKMVHFVGSDCHHAAHASLLMEVVKTDLYQKALSLPLLNNSLI